MNNKINRIIYTESRLFEIIDTMKDPQIEIRKFNIDGKGKGVPSVKITAVANGGIVYYKYEHGGLIGMKRFVDKIEGYPNVKEV